MAVGFLGFTGSLLFTHLCTGPLDPPHSSWYIFWYLSRSAVKFSSKNSFTVHFCRKNPSRTPDHGFMVQYGMVWYGTAGEKGACGVSGSGYLHYDGGLNITELEDWKGLEYPTGHVMAQRSCLCFFIINKTFKKYFCVKKLIQN